MAVSTCACVVLLDTRGFSPSIFPTLSGWPACWLAEVLRGTLPFQLTEVSLSLPLRASPHPALLTDAARASFSLPLVPNQAPLKVPLSVYTEQSGPWFPAQRSEFSGSRRQPSSLGTPERTRLLTAGSLPLQCPPPSQQPPPLSPRQRGLLAHRLVDLSYF